MVSLKICGKFENILNQMFIYFKNQLKMLMRAADFCGEHSVGAWQ